VVFDLALANAHEILQLPARRAEGIADSDIGVLVGMVEASIAVDDDVVSAGNFEKNAHRVGIAFLVALLRTLDDDAARDYAVIELFEL